MKFLFLSLFLTLTLVACKSDEVASTAADNQDSDIPATQDPDNNSGQGSGGAPGPGPGPVVGNPGGSQGGSTPGGSIPEEVKDLTETGAGTISEGDKGVAYPEVGSEPPPVVGPGLEPGSDDFRPIVSFEETPTRAIASQDSDFKIWAGDNLGGRGIKEIKCQLDDGPLEVCDEETQFSNLDDGEHKVVVIATDKDNNESHPIEYIWYVDTTPPALAISSAPEPLSTSPRGPFEFDVEDVVSGVDTVECQIDNQAFVDCQQGWDQSDLEEGKRTLTVRAKDRVGNLSPEVTYDWIIDLTPPSLQITQAPNSLTSSAEAKFEFIAVDDNGIKNYECQLNNSGFQPCQSPLDFDKLAEGDNHFEVRSTDNAGLISAPVNHSWVIDQTPPTVLISRHPANPSSVSNAIFEFEGADNVSPVVTFECQRDGQSFQACQSPLNLVGLSDGNHNFSVRSKDEVGNLSSIASYSWQIDTIAPVVQITQQPTNPTGQADANIEFVASDLGTGVAEYLCQLDGTILPSCGSPSLLANLREGNHTFSVRAKDHAGNLSAAADAWWFLDLTGPTIAFDQTPPIVVFIGDQANILFQVFDDTGVDSVLCTLNGQSIPCQAGALLSIPAVDVDNLDFVVSASDPLGNLSSASIQWQTDFNYLNQETSITVDQDRPVDILFVVDNSGSMDDERANLAQRIDGMIDKIDGLDWQIAVISTDVLSATNADGNFIPLNGRPGEYILDATMDKTEAQDVFGATVQNFGNGSAQEQGIYATKRAIDRYINGETNHQQFFRDRADLSVVVLSDEDENSDGNNVKITPQNFVSFVNNTWQGEKHLTFHSIITLPGDTNCFNSQSFAKYGNTYKELSELTGLGTVGGAIIGSVCDPNYTNQLADIGQSVKDRKNSIPLNCIPEDINSDGTPDYEVFFRADNQAPYQPFNTQALLQENRLTYTDLLPPGDYKVNYKCLEENIIASNP